MIIAHTRRLYTTIQNLSPQSFPAAACFWHVKRCRRIKRKWFPMLCLLRIPPGYDGETVPWHRIAPILASESLHLFLNCRILELKCLI
jgi:hypothetical protein